MQSENKKNVIIIHFLNSGIFLMKYNINHKWGKHAMREGFIAEVDNYIAFGSHILERKSRLFICNSNSFPILFISVCP